MSVMVLVAFSTFTRNDFFARSVLICSVAALVPHSVSYCATKWLAVLVNLQSDLSLPM